MHSLIAVELVIVYVVAFLIIDTINDIYKRIWKKTNNLIDDDALNIFFTLCVAFMSRNICELIFNIITYWTKANQY